MEQEKYILLKLSETVVYEFFSEGPKGRIRKLVRFLLLEEFPDRTYNIGFGDWKMYRDDFDDKAISNNADSQKVLHTVAAAILDFARKHPDAWIYAEGSTPSRTRLYQISINRFWKEIVPQFIVFGLLADEWLPFKKGINYDAFLIRPK